MDKVSSPKMKESLDHDVELCQQSGGAKKRWRLGFAGKVEGTLVEGRDG